MAGELSILIAKILAVMFFTIGVGAFFNKDYFQKIYDDVFKSYGSTLLFGTFALIMGFIIVTYHNIWVADWTVAITVIGWLALIRGVLFLAVPKFLQNFARPIFKGPLTKILPYTTIVLGLAFGYFGFLA